MQRLHRLTVREITDALNVKYSAGFGMRLTLGMVVGKLSRIKKRRLRG